MPRGIGYGFGPYAPDRYDDRGQDRIVDLMLRGGDIEAFGAEQKGRALGGIVEGVGEGVVGVLGALRQKREKDSEEKRIKEYSEYIREGWDGDPRKMIAVSVETFGPEIGFPAAETALRFATLSDPEVSPEEQLKNFATGVKMLGQLPEAMQKENFPLVMAASAPLLAAQFGLDPSTLPTEWSPEAMETGQKMASLLLGEKPAEPIKLGKSDRLVTPEGEEIVAAVPEVEVVDPLEQRLKELKIAQAEKDLRADPSEPQPSLNDIDKIAQRWKTATEPTREIGRQVRLMEEGLKSARQGDLAAGSQAILVTFQKILDPTSVVRESEYARSASGQSAISRAQGIIDRLSKGGAGVPVSELEKFAELARRMATAGSSEYLEAERKRLERLAENFNVDPDLVFEGIDYAAPEEAPANPFSGDSDAAANPFR